MNLRPYGEEDDIENHLMTASDLPCRVQLKGGDRALQDDRWVRWDMSRQCTAPKCKKCVITEMAYPCVRLSTEWANLFNQHVKMSGVEDAVMRVMLQQSIQPLKCNVCRNGDATQKIVPSSIKLPAMLVVSMEANKKQSTEDRDLKLNIGNLVYSLTGIAFYRPGHYTCTWRLGDNWYYYDDVKPKPQMCKTSPKITPPGFTRRLMYYVQENKPAHPFDGTKTEKAMDYAMSAEGGVNQQEGTELLQ
jgi:hypothetical protein